MIKNTRAALESKYSKSEIESTTHAVNAQYELWRKKILGEK